MPFLDSFTHKSLGFSVHMFNRRFVSALYLCLHPATCSVSMYTCFDAVAVC